MHGTHWETLILYPILCAVGWYLASRARITHALWSRYPLWLDHYLACSACFGFVLGVACGLLGWWQRWPFLHLAADWPLTPLVTGLCGIWWTPIAARLHADALYYLGSPVKEDNAEA